MAELRTLARPYAKAAFQAAESAAALQDWSQQLALLSALAGEEKVAALIASPTASAESQVSALTVLVGDELDQNLGNFLAVLADNKRLPLLPTIAELFAELKAAKERTVDVNIRTAFALSDETEQQLHRALQEKLQREIVVETQLDSDLLGGVVIRAGDVVIDGSIKGRLAKLAETLSA